MNPVLGQPAMYNPYGSVPPLPAGWVEHRTPTGQPYWYSTLTGQSSWVYPMAPVAPVAAAAAPKKKKQIKKKIPGTQWLFVLTHDGYEFYYDRETKKSVWEMPEDLKEPMEQLKKLEEEEAEAKKKQEEEEAKKKQEEEEAAAVQREKEAEESRKRALLEEEEKQLEAKRVRLEGDITNDAQEDLNKEQELDATEMTEEDIMWQLQQMEEEGEGEEENEEEEQHQLQQQQETLKEEEPPKEKKPVLSEAECIAKFNELLQERNISPFAMYATEYPQLMNDPRFSLVPANKQKSLFNKYCHDLGEKLKDEKKKKNSKKPEDEFRELLASKVKVKMYWDDFRRKYKDDVRFKAISTTKEREALFKEHIKHHLNKDPVGEYMNLLASTKEIKVGMRWRDAKKILEKDDRYYAIEDKDKREDLFRDYLERL